MHFVVAPCVVREIVAKIVGKSVRQIRGILRIGTESTDLSRAFDARLIGALGIDPLEVDRQGYIKIRLPLFKPDDTGIHQRVVGCRNRD